MYNETHGIGWDTGSLTRSRRSERKSLRKTHVWWPLCGQSKRRVKPSAPPRLLPPAPLSPGSRRPRASGCR